MKALIWKEWRENLKWAVLPGLLILLPMVLLGGPHEPMFGVGGELLLFLIAALFGAVLGFLQVFFEASGDKRSLLLHRPLSRSRIFLGKALAGVGIYLLALGIPFVGVQAWMATPGHMAAPYQWETGLPWLADILAGLVYYFAGMLTAQREARWYGSRGLGLATAFLCTVLVWSLPEFWQALLVIVILGTLVGLAAWGSFLAGGAYAPQPRLAKAALAVTLLTGLLVVSFIGKLMIGQWYHSGSITDYYHLDRQGRVLIVPWKDGVGPTEPLTDLEGHVLPDLQGRRVDRNLIDEIEAPLAHLGWARHRSYRNPGRFYVEYLNDSRPSREDWFYVHEQGRLLGYDADYHQFLGSFGPDGFIPAGQSPSPQPSPPAGGEGRVRGQPGESFQGALRYLTLPWKALPPPYLAFPGGVYDVDFSRRTIRKLFTPPAGETVLWATRWKDRREKGSLVVVSTDKSVHVLTEAGAPVVSVPLVYGREQYRLASVGRLEAPQRYVFWYHPANQFLEPEELLTLPGYLLEYDGAGHELARRTLPRLPLGESSSVESLFGLATPLTEVTTLVGTFRGLRSEVRSTGGKERWALLELLESWIPYFIPKAVLLETKDGVFFGFTAMTLLSAGACALVCFLLARRYAFSRARRIGWALCGFLFGWTGLVLMLALQDWPARVSCPSCRQPRRVDRACCEHCGAPHAVPAPDGTEVFEATDAAPHAASALANVAAASASAAPLA
jgi:hypothetical protein